MTERITLTDEEVNKIADVMSFDVSYSQQEAIKAVFDAYNRIRFGDSIGTVREGPDGRRAIKVGDTGWLCTKVAGASYWRTDKDVKDWTVVLEGKE